MDAQQDLGCLVHFYKRGSPQKYLDLSVPSPSKLSLLQEEGLIHLVGSHYVDFFGYRGIGAGNDVDEEEKNTDDDADMEEAEYLVKEAEDPLFKEERSDEALRPGFSLPPEITDFRIGLANVKKGNIIPR